MPLPVRVLDDARDALAHAKEANPKIDPRVLRRFEQKLRLTEGAVAQPKQAITTHAGLRAVLMTAEASAASRPPSLDQTRALESLRAEVARRDEASRAGGAKADTLLASLAEDTARLRKLATPKPLKKAAAAKKAAPPKKGAPAKTPKKRAS